jgi:hypothetical protein
LDIVTGCSNYLGWEPRLRPGQPYWEAYQLEVRKLRAAIESGRRIPKQQATLTNLALALEYSRRNHLPVHSPIALLHRIPEALALAYIPPAVSDLEAAITNAIAWEKTRDDDQSLRWIHRLVRASGPGRRDVMNDWKQAGRG